MDETPIAKRDDMGEFIAQSKQNATTLKDLRSELTEGLSELRKAIERLYFQTRPNFSAMLALAGILLTVIGMVAAPIGFFIWHAIQNNSVLVKDLDDKLQREYRLSIETATQKTENVNQQSKERHDHVVVLIQAIEKRIDNLEAWDKEKTKSDLEELRQRRMRDGEVRK